MELYNPVEAERNATPESLRAAVDFIRANQHREYTLSFETNPQSSKLVELAVLNAVSDLAISEPAFKPVPDSYDPSDEQIMADRGWLLLRQHLFQHFDDHMKTRNYVLEGVWKQFEPVAKLIEPIADYALCWVPIWQLLENPWHTVNAIFSLLEGSYMKRSPVFQTTAHRMEMNHMLAASAAKVDYLKVRPERMPLPPEGLINLYCHDTVLGDIFKLKVPLPWRFDSRYSHTHIIGRTGSGKTTVLESMVSLDLVLKKRPSVVVITPQGDLVRRWKNGPDPINPVVIDPRDTEYPPAINPFAVKAERFASLSSADRERISAGIIQLFDFLFEGFGLDLTPKMKTLWSYVVRCLITFPQSLGRNATIKDVARFLQFPQEYADAIAKLPDTQRDFLTRNLLDPKANTFKETREQLGYRIDRLLADPNLERLLTAPETKLDFYEELNKGTFLLIDTAQDFLGEGSAMFGRLVLTVIFQAIIAREAIPEKDRHPTFIYIDEAGTYFSEALDEMLRKARKYHCGIIIAHHFMDEAKGNLRPSLVSQPGSRFAAPNHKDTAELAPEMKTTRDFLTDLKEHEFAAFIRGVTPRAISLKLKPVHPKQITSEAGLKARMWSNRERVSLGSKTVQETPQIETSSEEWE